MALKLAAERGLGRLAAGIADAAPLAAALGHFRFVSGLCCRYARLASRVHRDSSELSF